MRFLCLHGRGTNSRTLELQTAALRYALGPTHDWDFVEGTVSIPPDPAIRHLLSAHDETYAYFEYTLDSITTAITDLRTYIEENGPFDGILAFSEGASLASSLIAQQSPDSDQDSRLFDVKLAIFISARPGFDTTGDGRVLEYEKDGEVITVPTVHVLGERDPAVEESRGLVKLCEEGGREVYVHGGGHEVPRGKREVDEMRGCVERCLERVVFGA